MVKFFTSWWKEIDKFNFIIIIAIITIGLILSYSINKDFTFFNKHLIIFNISDLY